MCICHCFHPSLFAARPYVCACVPRVLAGSGLDTRSRCMSEHALHCSRRPVSRAVRVTHASTEVTDSDLRQLDSSETSTPYLERASPDLPVEDTIYSYWQNHFIYRLVGVRQFCSVSFGTQIGGSTRNSNLQLILIQLNSYLGICGV